jgi:anti-anti-sigma regulatory factor
MQATVRVVQGRVPATVLHFPGQLDASNYRDVVAEAQKAFAAGARNVLLDLGDVAHVSISGLVALQSIAALLRGDELPDSQAGWSAIHAIHRDRDTGIQPHFKLLSPQPRVDRVLETVGFKRYLEAFADQDVAVASFGPDGLAPDPAMEEGCGRKAVY